MSPTPLRRLRARAAVVAGRTRAALRDVVISALAAAVAWLIATYGLGHQQPVFAAICAIVSLAPGLPSHGKQAVGLITGMAIGILVGEAVLALNPLPDATWVWLVQLVLAVFCAMMLSSGLGWSPVLVIQAGVSVVLVLAVGPQSAGLHRLVDGAVGVAIGLACSQFLLTPDPVKKLAAAMQAFLNELADGLEATAETIDRRAAGGPVPQGSSPDRAAEPAFGAEQHLARAWANLRDVQDSIGSAREGARWSLRGRLLARPLRQAIGRESRQAVYLYAHALMLGEAVTLALHGGGDAPAGLPAGLAHRIRAAAGHCRLILVARSGHDAGAHSAAPLLPETGPAPGGARASDMGPSDTGAASADPRWRDVQDHLDQLERRLRRLARVVNTWPGIGDRQAAADRRRQSGTPEA